MNKERKNFLLQVLAVVLLLLLLLLHVIKNVNMENGNVCGSAKDDTCTFTVCIFAIGQCYYFQRVIILI
jgi:hypothetical protein